MYVVNADGSNALHISADQRTPGRGGAAHRGRGRGRPGGKGLCCWLKPASPGCGHRTLGSGESADCGRVEPNSRALDGLTPLRFAACRGHLETIKVLLRAKANPLLTFFSYSVGHSGKVKLLSQVVPLDGAAQYGRLEVARELTQVCGIKRCGGSSGGVDALHFAAKNHST